MKILFTIAVLLLVTGGCKKDPDPEYDLIAPVITMTAPVQGQLFTGGQVIRIQGTVQDNIYIAELHIHVSDLNSGSLLMDVHLYPGGPMINLDQPFSITPGNSYRIQVIATDRQVNETRSTIEISCQ
jgi:hypothetical protein